MPEEFFDVAYINFDKAVLHGRVRAGRDEFGCRIERDVEIVLSDDQKRAVEDMNSDHQQAMQRLLRSFVEDHPHA